MCFPCYSTEWKFRQESYYKQTGSLRISDLQKNTENNLGVYQVTNVEVLTRMGKKEGSFENYQN